MDPTLGEVGPVIGLDDQGWSVLAEEASQQASDVLGRGPGDGQGVEDESGGEVPDSEEDGQFPVDGAVGVGIVHGPDGAGLPPGESIIDGVAVVLAESPEQSLPFGPGDVGKVGVKFAQGDIALVDQEEGEDLDLLCLGGDSRLGAERLRSLPDILPPSAQGVGFDAQFITETTQVPSGMPDRPAGMGEGSEAESPFAFTPVGLPARPMAGGQATVTDEAFAHGAGEEGPVTPFTPRPGRWQAGGRRQWVADDGQWRFFDNPLSLPPIPAAISS